MLSPGPFATHSIESGNAFLSQFIYPAHNQQNMIGVVDRSQLFARAQRHTHTYIHIYIF